ncbi:MAG: SUMF1/EgtB/PvdO family nonheme iron enzyme [Phycisphaerae bacterium]
MHEDHAPTDHDRTLVNAVRQQVEAAEARHGAKPERIGAYRILRVLGQGGMGVVYQAEQQHPQRSVALKVMRAGFTSPEMLRRFRKEAQALGRLHHVGIAQIYEGSTADSDHGLQSFFAMELVDGLPITDYCEAHKLKKEQRLELLARVADAVEHAHQHNVIHRDLKPSNILVDPTGQPKILDFGVARVTDADVHAVTFKTDARKLIGTLPYMSPEQIRGDPHAVDNRCDVYALGVLGYRMLTGRYPFHIPRKSIPEAVRVIHEEEPTRLSLLDRSLRGDVETIILKALEKDPRRRYQSSAEFAADLRRYLNEEPIRARPVSRFYRFRKFARRNKALVGGIAGIIVALSVGLGISARAYQLADRRLEEFRRLDDARVLVLYLSEAQRLGPAYPENVPAMESWLKKAEQLRPRLVEYREKLARLHERNIAFNLPMDLDRTGLRHGEELGEVRRTLAKERAALAALTAPDAPSGGLISAARLRERIRRLEQDEAKLASLIPRQHVCIFRDPADRLQHDVLVRLVNDLQAFFQPRTGVVAIVKKRLAFARTVKARTVDRYREAWAAAIAAIADPTVCPKYRGLRIAPQVGLIPLGRDPVSGLWEFGHLQTGEPPRRDSDGRLIITPRVGLVFVLLPGGTFRMGAEPPTVDRPDGSPNVDPFADVNERPVHEVTLAPFFISKYEMTQQQWERATGRNPSTQQQAVDESGSAPVRAQPVENISWAACEDVLWNLGFSPPTEAQWEYAARAGTATPWWTGTRAVSLRGAANLADQSYRRHGGPRSGTYDDWLDDGYGGVHAPVGRFRPNGFGLHDVLGNVSEWCFDALGAYDLPVRKGDGKRKAGRGEAGYRVVRGGSFHSTAAAARSAARDGAPPEYRHADLGIRPVRAVSGSTKQAPVETGGGGGSRSSP